MAERIVEPILDPGVPVPITEPLRFPEELTPLEFALTQKQRLAILQRDGNRCQATVPHHHDKKHPLEVDHLIPQRYADQFGIDADLPEFLLSKCRNAHDLRHKDRITARDEWRESHNGSFNQMFLERNQLLQHGEIYWDPTYDRTDITRAVQLTQKAKSKGWVFPANRNKQ